jgi:hypothetical protein
MSTRSLIGRQKADGTVEYVYCHYDGYVTGVGAMLLAHWTDPASVEELLSLGDLSSLGSTIGEKHPFDRWALSEADRERVKDWCLFYGRDREDEGCAARISPNDKLYAMIRGVQVRYLLGLDGRWLINHRRLEWTSLEEILAEELSVRPSDAANPSPG